MLTQLRNGFLFACSALIGLTVAGSVANAQAAKKDWTLLVFINGHNNLDSFGAFNINQMESVGSTDRVNVVVQWASLAAKTTKRLYIQKDNDLSNVTSPVVMDMPTVDMGDKNSLLDFIKWGATNYPAQHYMISVWNHGSGWHLKNAEVNGRDIHVSDISYDDKTGHHITTEELGQVMIDTASFLGQKVDVYGSDACLMAMVEVIQEMSGSVKTFVGSEETEPGAGWPYDRFLTSLTANPSASSNEVGKMLTDAYKSYYDGEQNGDTTFSAIDVSKMSDVIEKIVNLREKLSLVSDLKIVQTAASQSQRFLYSDYVDIGDALANIKTALSKTGEAQGELEQLSASLSGAIVANGVTGSGRATGLSVWWPTYAGDWTKYKDRYMGLKFDKQAHWSDFLSKMF